MLLLAKSTKFVLNFSDIWSAIKFDKAELLLLISDCLRDQNLEKFLEINLSNNLSVKISLALIFINNLKFFIFCMTFSFV